ncbi:MAG: biotin--[acetyl-CoA-carboxylase] ligase, partial [Actinobacteria bacterium]|nr:biotin--[acetyl-CoA-carboxylase] ligase [Actinomycetota bacterium]
CFKEITSTSDFASGLALEAEKYSARNANEKVMLNGTVIVSEKQSKGRGRFDRKWFSPKGGLWFTIIQKPRTELKDLHKTTVLAASTIIESLKIFIANKTQAEKNLKIKWPNDIYFSGKKLAGILCETENIGKNLYLFTGIGINMNFPSRVIDNHEFKAISVFDINGKKTDSNSLLAELLNIYEKNYEHFEKSADFYSIFKKIEKIIYL